MELKKSTTHVVVVFPGSYPPGQKKDVDLVPRSWLKLEKNEWMCRCPHEKDYSKRTKWTKESKPPKQTWLKWRVNIVKEAKDYNEGVRRLHRSYANSNVESTSAGDDSDNEANNTDKQQPVVMENNKKKSELEQPIPIDETISENESEGTTDSYPEFSPNATPGSGAKSHVNIPRCESLTDTEDSSGVDENDQTIMNITPQRRSKKKVAQFHAQKRSATIQSETTDVRSPSPPAKKHRRTLSDNEKSEQFEIRPKLVLMEILEKMEGRILNKIDSAKRSVLYDLGKKVTEMKNTMILNSGPSGMKIVEHRKTLDTELPFRDAETFAAFDAALLTAPNKEQALKSIMATAISGAISHKEAVANILKSVLGKPVQQVYSAYGRQIKGTGKKNFSITKTCSCMQDVICEARDITRENILTLTSRWLSGSVDREGGRVRPMRSVTPVVQLIPPAPAIPEVQNERAAPADNPDEQS